MAWQNADGLYVEFGSDKKRRGKYVNKATDLVTFGARKQVELDIDLAQLGANGTNYAADLNNDGTRDGFTGGDVYIPQNSSVIDVIYVASEAAAGGTSFKVGTAQANGTVIDDDSLLTPTDGALANINAAGKRTFGTGVHTATAAGTPGVGAVDAYVLVTAAGTFTAGKGRLIITYIDGQPDLP
jgi:hypothetical protein